MATTRRYPASDDQKQRLPQSVRVLAGSPPTPRRIFGSFGAFHFLGGRMWMSRWIPAETRFWNLVNKTESCWLWMSNRRGFRRGYGVMRRDGRFVAAHRFSYELAKGPIPPGLTIDHLCRVPLCVNPDHLEAVTMQVNILRGESPPAKNARKVLCAKHGIPLIRGVYRYYRGCRRCKAESSARYKAKARLRKRLSLPS